MGFKEQISKLRKRNNMNQTELAEKMNVRQYVVSSWETGRSEPSIEQLIKLSDIFDVSIDYLLDKPFIIVNNENDFNKVIENIKLDSEDDFINEVFNLCNDLNIEKKKLSKHLSILANNMMERGSIFLFFNEKNYKSNSSTVFIIFLISTWASVK